METPDQLTTINEVKADMEREIPMDRLISGDVGYGKTEIAVRAAFKAVQDGKQVAVLVPTTLLAQQHYETFTERFSGFPLVVKPLSRFQSGKEAKETADGVKSGSVDVVIGTHRLLSKDFGFKDLGLVIVDEEQRFGVEHKEALKKMRTNVDVLAMSATPIPRTLEMSLTGIRETSTLATPPEERHPVLTYVGPYTDKQTSAAIRRELMREGQVFFVHNRVSTIDRTAAKIRELVPEARVEVAHGQMSESRLEQIIVDFWEKRFDVLVCTTIIETGLDISNANTLIVDGADKYGLSQLHQLRGRVGRGRERAYAYFLYPSEKPLGEVALERLKAVATHNELGAGMQLAMKDLEIRGAGNLLGGEQSGHIQGVGFDLYIRLVGEAVAEYRGEAEEKAAEMKIELPVNAHLPHDYVPGERLRLEAYRKLASAITYEAIDEVLAELVDRYGELPLPATEPDRRRPVPGGRPRGRVVRRRAAGELHQVLPGAAARVQAHAADPDVSRRAGQAGAGRGARFPSRRPPGSAAGTCRTPRSSSGPTASSGTSSPTRRICHTGGERKRMMGGHHAASGAAAWVAIASTGPYTLGWYPLDATGIVIGGMATAGTALVCDWDHRSSTVAHSLPPLSNVIAVGIENASGGHRQGTHSLLGRGLLRAARRDGRADPAADRLGAAVRGRRACCACS